MVHKTPILDRIEKIKLERDKVKVQEADRIRQVAMEKGMSGKGELSKEETETARKAMEKVGIPPFGEGGGQLR